MRETAIAVDRVPVAIGSAGNSVRSLHFEGMVPSDTDFDVAIESGGPISIYRDRHIRRRL